MNTAPDNYETARLIHKAFRLLTSQTRIAATNGCKKAALRVMSEMIAHHEALKAFGYNTNDEGRLVKRELTLVQKLRKAKKVVVVGEALSHSVKNKIINIKAPKRLSETEQAFTLMKRWSDLK